MKLTEKLKNKRFIMALAGLVGLMGMTLAPLSQAGWWYRWHVGPRPAAYHPYHHYYYRHVSVHRYCSKGRCYVHRHVWVNR